MNSGYAKVILAGRIFKAAVVEQIGSTQVAKFSIGAGRRYRDKKTNQMVNRDMYIECLAWGKLAEPIANFIKPGNDYLIEGTLEYDTWDDKTTGKKRSKHYVNVCEFRALSPAPKKEAAADPEPEPASSEPSEAASDPGNDDDVPF